MANIHPTAIVSPRATIADDVTIGPFTVVHDDVVLGAGTIVESHCEIGYPTTLAAGRPLVLGERSLVRSHSVFYAGSTFGPDLRTGHRVTVREQTTAGRDLQIGTLGDIQGYCEIGDYVRTHSNVHIGQKSVLQDFVWIFPYSVLTNDPHPPSHVLQGVVVETYAVIATMCVVLPGVRIGSGALVGAHSMVTRNVEPGMLVSGAPAKPRRATKEIALQDGSGPAYPWMRHFHRGYPAEVVAEWKRLYGTNA